MRWHAWDRGWLAVVLAGLIALAIHQNGWWHDFPIGLGQDEIPFALAAARVASAGDLNPKWFQHPGSTTIYPLALMLHFWNALSFGGPLTAPDPSLASRVASDPAPAVLFGRVISTAYLLASLPFLYLIGRRAFGRRVAIVACWLWVLLPIPGIHAEVLRTDTAGTFFGLVVVWLTLRYRAAPSLTAAVAVGAAGGLATASRYFIAVYLIWFAGVALVTVRRVVPVARDVLAAGLVALLVFFLVSPFLALDYPTTVAGLTHEMRTGQIGADGLAPPEKFGWYLGVALPMILSWPVMVASVAGIVIALVRRSQEQFLIAALVIFFTASISVPALHWVRWVIPVAPILLLFAAAAVLDVSRLPVGSPRLRTALTGVALAAIFAIPGWQMAIQTVSRTRDSTGIEARLWITENIPRGTRVVTEPLGPVIEDLGLDVEVVPHLAVGDLAEFRARKVRFLISTSYVYGRFTSDPDRFDWVLDGYTVIRREARLAKEFKPSTFQSGPSIWVYDLDTVR
ncbi:MAG: glycosyltransferase family 39 protein [Dehalococcoidia bacterium]